MGAFLERSEPVRGATWHDFDGVVELLVRQNRAASGVAAVRDEFVRADWELPSFEVGRDNWLYGAAAYAAVSPGGELMLVAPDGTTADVLLERAIARGRERGLGKLELRPLAGDEVHSALLDRHGFVLQTDVLAMGRALSASEQQPEWPAGIGVRTFDPADGTAVHALLAQAYGGWDSLYERLGFTVQRREQIWALSL